MCHENLFVINLGQKLTRPRAWRTLRQVDFNTGLGGSEDIASKNSIE